MAFKVSIFQTANTDHTGSHLQYHHCSILGVLRHCGDPVNYFGSVLCYKSLSSNQQFNYWHLDHNHRYLLNTTFKIMFSVLDSSQF